MISVHNQRTKKLRKIDPQRGGSGHNSNPAGDKELEAECKSSVSRNTLFSVIDIFI